MRAAQILHARMDFLGCPVFHTPVWAFGIWARSRQSGFGLNLVVGAESGEFQKWQVSIGYKNRSAVLPVCTPVFASDTRRFCRPELFQLQCKEQRKFACINRAPLQALPRQLQAALHQLPHRVLMRAPSSMACTTKTP
jgi:hypothetical protein